MRRLVTIVVLFVGGVPAVLALPAFPQRPKVAPTPAPAAATSRTTLTTQARPASSVLNNSRDESVLARVTVYWAKGGNGSDRYTRRHQSAIGQPLRSGHCAVDPRKIPYGSKVVLPTGETLAAVDTGTAVKNRKAARQSGRTAPERNALVVDRFFETKRQALAWANSHPPFMPVHVVKPAQTAPTQQPLLVRKAQPVLIAGKTSASSATTRNRLSTVGR